MQTACPLITRTNKIRDSEKWVLSLNKKIKAITVIGTVNSEFSHKPKGSHHTYVYGKVF